MVIRFHFPSSIPVTQKEKLRFRKVKGPAGGLPARMGRGKTPGQALSSP